MRFDKAGLAKMALQARGMAYAPYSGFQVGAAILADDGRVFTGCNVENASYGLTVCAERAALCKAVSEGARQFIAIAVAGGAEAEPFPLQDCPPCGACRQSLAEFAGEGDMLVLSVRSENDWDSCTLSSLLPGPFGCNHL